MFESRHTYTLETVPYILKSSNSVASVTDGSRFRTKREAEGQAAEYLAGGLLLEVKLEEEEAVASE